MTQLTCRTGMILVTAAGVLLARPMAAASDENSSDGGQKRSLLLQGGPITFRSVERSPKEKKEVSWLGVATAEASDVLEAQLGLKSGEGLTVIMVASNSPAERAGLRKNDVLVEFEGQMLVDPIQFRKLVQMHPEGETVKITFFREGKRQSLSVKLGKTWENAALDDGESGSDRMKLEIENLGDRMGSLNQSLAASKGKLNLELERVVEGRAEMKRAMEETRRAIERAVRESHQGNAKTFGSFGKDLKDLLEGGVDLDKDATVVIKRDSKSAKSMVKADDSGDYIIIADPRKRLTAHDRSGKLLFDGAIETPEEQAKVPKEVWEKVKPMLDQIGTIKEGDPQSNNSAEELKS